MFRNGSAERFPLQLIVTNLPCSIHGFFDVTGLQDIKLLLA